ncbi:MAG: anthranilate synthase component I family protein [Ferruginibacter sp.]
MKNNIASFAITDSKAFKMKMLNWSRRFNIFCFLDNSNYPGEPAFECLLAAGCKNSVSITGGDALGSLQAFSDQNNDWLFGHLGYDVLNSRPAASPAIKDEVEFEDGFFFTAEILLRLKNNELIIESGNIDPGVIFNAINEQDSFIQKAAPVNIHFTKGTSESEYKDIINSLKGHILRGDCYEINFCQHFFAHDVSIDPVYYYQQLSGISPNPFGAFYKLNDKYCLCASPERFLKRTGTKLISQPIKGTSKRNLADAVADEQNKNYLINSDKEKSENVMVVDLVRNDLSKVCIEGSVHVKELFGIYSFPQVHQMISTIEGQVDPGTAWTDMIRACFPMGSMTGAPKIKVMDLIKKYERSPRGLFSGSIGYITPERDFDLNVVIRSLMYDETKNIISFKAGGGITFNSDPEQEYEECMLKAEAIIRILKNV